MTIQDLGSLGELIAAIATVATLGYLATQIRLGNRLARAEAYRMPNSELNSINAAFGTDHTFRPAMRKVLTGAARTDLSEDERILVDFYLFSITNVYEQIAREIDQGILRPETLEDFGGKGLFVLPYYQTSWKLYREQLSSELVSSFERRYGLDPAIHAEW